MDSQQPYRSSRITPKPVVQGPQTAIVVGKSGEEIWPDKYGRVKVQFHWDRYGKLNETSSCWVRVAQLWAGKTWGGIHIPRIGQEVIVEFLEGDPDRPIITGRVYNADNMPPYGLPDNKTQSGIKSRSTKEGSGDNFNEIRFEDKKGSEEVFVQAEKDWNTVTKNNLTESVGNDETLEVGANRKRTVGGKEDVDINGGDQTIKVNGGKQLITISSDRVKTVHGKEDVNITGGNQTVNITGGSQETTISANQKTNVHANREVTVIGNSKREVMSNEEIHVVGARKVAVDSTEFFEWKGPSTKLTYGVDTSTFFGAKVSNSMAVTTEAFVGAKLAASASVDATVNKAKQLNQSPNQELKGDIKVSIEGGAQIVLKSGGSIAIEASGAVGIESDALIKLSAPTIMVDGTLNVNGVNLTVPK